MTLEIKNPVFNSFKIYPNPTNDFVTVESESTVDKIEVYNLLGQLIISQKSNKINLSDYNKGIYMIQIVFENGQKSTQKIIKE